MSVNISDLLLKASESNISILLKNQKLSLKVPNKVEIDPSLIQVIKKNKLEIIDYLSEENIQLKEANSLKSGITKFDRDVIDKIPLSFAQERLWFIDKLQGSVHYHAPIVLRLTGELDQEILHQIFKTIVNRHEILRTIYKEVDGLAYQEILPANQWAMDFTDLSSPDCSDSIEELIDQTVNTPFDLTNDHMLRIHLVKSAPNEHLMILVVHHIASDGWSTPILVQEFYQLYNNLSQGQEVKLNELPIQYADYAFWQRQHLTDEVLEEKLNYWKEKLADTKVLALPTDYERPLEQSTKGSSLVFGLEDSLSHSLKSMAKQEGVTVFMLLLAAFKVLLYKYSGQTDICVGSPVANRSQSKTENLIGLFINTLPLRSILNGSSSFKAFLAEVKQTCIDGFAHQDVPLERIVNKVEQGRDLSRGSFFQILFELQNQEEWPELSLGELDLKLEPLGTEVSRFDLKFGIAETNQGIDIAITYCSELFAQQSIEKLQQHFQQLLVSIVEAPLSELDGLTLLDSAENQWLLNLNQDQIELPKDVTIVDLFEEQVRLNPSTPSVVYDGTSLTYSELDEYANQLARYLQKQGVSIGDFVGVSSDNPLEMMGGIWGVLKLGATYVPIDPNLPEERSKYIIKDAGLKYILSNTQSELATNDDGNLQIIHLDEISDELSELSAAPLEKKPIGSDAVYVIYTSGSTGQPKGVVLSHDNLTDYLFGFWDKVNLSDCKQYGLMSTMSADLGNTIIYGGLLKGGTIHLFNKEQLSDQDYLHSYFSDYQIDCMKIVPSHWKALEQDGQLLIPQDTIIFGGEQLPLQSIKNIQANAPELTIINHYGPTETTIGKLLYQVQPGENRLKTPIGRPFANAEVYVVDAKNQLCPVGVTGELLIGGPGVSQGYLNRADLTSERFISHPFNPYAKSKVYRTGDLVRMLSDGNIEYRGRIDDQVKIRGYRIEPGEVKNVLDKSEAVKDSVVIVDRDANEELRLVGYVVPTQDFNKEELVNYLQKILPDYMIPSLLIPLEQIPLTSNGKVNRKALPTTQDLVISEVEYIAPRNATEQSLALIWQLRLKVDQIGIHDNFFQLGGHSLLATRVVAAIRKQLKVKIGIKDIFIYPTIKELAERMAEIDTSNQVMPSLKPMVRPERIPLSFAQERLWFIDKLQGSVHYHMPTILEFDDVVDQAILERTFQTIINRHEILRTVYEEDKGKAYQVIMAPDSWQLGYTDYSSMSYDQQAIDNFIEETAMSPFDFAKDHMLRAHLLKISDRKHLLVLVLHHIASDGWSMPLFVEEFLEIYQANTTNRQPNLVALKVQYADYALWQNRFSQDKIYQQKIKYWVDQLEGATPLNLQTDFSRPMVKSYDGDYLERKLSSDLSEKLQQVCQQENVTMFMLLEAVFKILLYKYSGQEDIVIGTPVANRKLQETESLIGFFVNTLALRTNINGNETIKELLQRIKDNTLNAFANQEIPFEKIVDSLGLERNLTTNPLFQVLYTYRNKIEAKELSSDDLRIKARKYNHKTSKFDLTFNVNEESETINLGIEYSSDLFLSETIERMIDHVEVLLSTLVSSIDYQISDLSILSSEEKEQLLVDFNNTEVSFSTHKTLVDLFREQVQKTPQNIALSFAGITMDYETLDQRSNQLAHYLQERGVKEDTLVLLCMDRSLEMMISILAILKAGGAYVPVDPEYPIERIEYIVKDCATQFIITQEIHEHLFDANTVYECLVLDRHKSLISKITTKAVKNNLTSNNLAYVIYTSGTTGKPKGVLLEHGNVVRLFKNDKALFDFNENDVWTMFHSFCFDFSVWEMFGALLFGGKLIIVPKEIAKDTSDFAKLLHSEKVTVLNQTPTAFYVLQQQVLLSQFELPIRYVIFGGEALNPSKLKEWKSQFPDCALINMYGITETTVHVTYKAITEEDIEAIKSNIGKPIPTLSCYILDEQHRLLPKGVAGELYVEGAGLARGYLNRPQLTEERFIQNPFNDKGKRLYKTGDLARWLSNGDLEYLGRVDNQVKIRGYRIELGEIEAALFQSPAISRCVVIAHENDIGVKKLVAYVVVENTFDKANLQQYLANRLPAYMVPQIYVRLDELPLTANGKIDKKSLPAPEITTDNTENYLAPRNKKEAQIVEIWQSLLNVEKIGVLDNFFELGGDSIITIQAVSRIKQLGYELRPRDLFQHQTIAALAAKIKVSSSLINAEQGRLDGEVKLLPIQQWLFENEWSGINHYNQSVLIKIDKSIELSQLEKAIETLYTQHDALRLSFNKTEQQNLSWTQSYGQKQAKLQVEELTRESSKDILTSSITEICKTYQNSLAIEEGELFKAVFIKTPASDQSNRLFLVIHHLAVDGVSWRILIEDLENYLNHLIKGEPIAIDNKSSSYREWANRLSEHAQSRQTLEQRDYWQSIEPLYTPLPSDFENTDSPATVSDQATVTVKLDKQLTKTLLQEVNQAYRTQINDILLSALARTISHWTKKATTVIGLEGHGREDIWGDINLSKTVGWFTTMYPIVLNGGTDLETSDLIKSTKEQLRLVPEKGIGFGLLRYMHPSPEIRQGLENIDWDIVFNYLGQFDNVAPKNQLLGAAEEATGKNISESFPLRHSLTINSSITSSELVLDWKYSSKQFNQQTIENISQQFIDNLTDLIQHCNSQEQSQVTPSDFALEKMINYKALDQFLDTKRSGVAESFRETINDIYPLSALQKGMLFHSIYDSDSTAYTEQFTADITDGLDVKAFRQAWNHLMNNHDILRTNFIHDRFAEPVQCVFDKLPLLIEDIDYSQYSEEAQQERITEFLEADRKKGFLFDHGPLMRFALIRKSNQNIKMIWTFHHILLDGWSMPIILGEFLSAYESFRKKQVPDFQPVDKFGDYLRYLANRNDNDTEVFWKKYLADFTTPSFLPFTSIKDNRNHGIGLVEDCTLKFNTTFTNKIRTFAQSNGVTVNTLLQGVWSFLLYRYTGNNDVVFGTTVSGRPTDLPNAEKKVGLYINTIPLRAQIMKGKLVAEWLQNIQQNQVLAREHQYTALNTIQNWIGLSKDFFDSILVFENYPLNDLVEEQDWSFKAKNVEVKEHTNYPLTIAAGLEEQLKIKFNYNTTVLDQQVVEMIKLHFEKVLDEIINKSKSYLDEINILSLEEEKNLLEEFNNTERDYPTDLTSVDLFCEQANKTPDAIALTHGNQSMTYQELDEKSNQFAHYLNKNGIEKESLVVLCIDRSLEMIIALLGILKNGNAYVPIDPTAPTSRVENILTDTQSNFVVVSQLTKDLFDFDTELNLISIDTEWPIIEQESTEKLNVLINPHDLMYVIYTSGSTGKPKGVMIEHTSNVNMSMDQIEKFGIQASDSVLQFASLSFDASVSEIFMAFYKGATLALIDREIITDEAALITYMKQQQISVVTLPPALLKIIDENQLDFLRVIITAGEAADPQKAYQCATFSNYFNAYGPTECAVCVSMYQVKNDEDRLTQIPIGKPTANLKVYILDENLQIQPINVEGDIYVSGIGLARGYLHNESLTNQKFLDHPFEPGQKIYKTGDKGYWLSDGNIMFTGRQDDQVKIRGHRVELGEIESIIQSHPQIVQSVVAYKKIATTNHLIAYVVLNEKITEQSIREYLQEKLPGYMIPSVFVEMDRIPITTSGKIDKKALPLPNNAMLMARVYTPPRNAIEKRLVEIWQEILALDRIGVYDNFFEIGGHSLSATRLMTSIKQEFALSIPLKAIFKYPCIEELTKYIRFSKIKVEDKKPSTVGEL